MNKYWMPITLWSVEKHIATKMIGDAMNHCETSDHAMSDFEMSWGYRHVSCSPNKTLIEVKLYHKFLLRKFFL